MDNYAKYVRVREIFTRKQWFRKIGDGPWQEMDLTAFHGLPPVAWLDNSPVAEQQSLVDEKFIEELGRAK